MNDIYYEMAEKVKRKLLDDLNGRVAVKVYAEIDTMIVFIKFKDFEYSHGINNIQEKMYAGNAVTDIVNEIKDDYKMCILKSFFKTERHKQRLKEKISV